jgi:hypothetical protein
MLPTMLQTRSASLFRYRPVGSDSFQPMDGEKLKTSRQTFELTPTVVQSFGAALSQVMGNTKLSAEGKYDAVLDLASGRLTKQREEITARLGDLNTALSAKHDRVAELYEPDQTHFGIQRDTEIRAASRKRSSSEIMSEVSAGDFSTVAAFRGYPASLMPLKAEQYAGAMNRYAASVDPASVDWIARIEAAKAVLTQQRDQLDSYSAEVVSDFTPRAAAS